MAEYIETKIVGLPSEIFTNEEYNFIIDVRNVGEFNASEIKGFVDSNSFSINISNRIIDIDFLEPGQAKQFRSSFISQVAQTNIDIHVIIESYKLNKSRRYRGDEDFQLKEDKKEVVIKQNFESDDKEGSIKKINVFNSLIASIIFSLLIILIVFICATFFIFKKKRFK